jgi:hypothetical protein
MTTQTPLPIIIDIVDKYQNGVAIKDLCDIFGLTRQGIKAMLKKYGDIKTRLIKEWVYLIFERSKRLPLGVDVREIILEDTKHYPLNLTITTYIDSKPKWGADVLRKAFGSFNEFLIMSGRKVNRYHNITKDDFINDLINVHTKYSKLNLNIYIKRGRYASNHATRLFGSWNNALLAANLPINWHTNVSDKDLIDDANRIYDEHGHFSWDLYDKLGKYSIDILIKKFGTIDNIRLLTGIKDRMMRSAKDIFDRVGRLNCEMFLRMTPYHRSQIVKYFGSFNRLAEKADIGYIGREIYSNEFLLHELRRFESVHGRPPSTHELNSSNGYPCDKTYFDRFGTIENAFKQAGITSLKPTGLDGNLYDSFEEAQIANILYKNFIAFDPHKRLNEDRQWKCDFYIPDQELWVEYDGLGETRQNLDRFKEKIEYYKNNNYKYIVMNKTDDVLNILNLYIKDWNKSDFELIDIDVGIAKDFLARNHYLGRSYPSSKFRYGLYYRPLKLMAGVALFGKNANPKENGLVLNRFCTIDRVIGNIETFFIGRCIRKLRRDGYSGLLVAFSDPRYHLGTIYKASNFMAVDGPKYSDYVYIDSNGREYHKSKCRVQAGQSEADYAESIGLRKIIVPQKTRWEYGV